MGSLGESEKGQTPFLDRIKRHNESYDRMISECRADAPIRLRLLAIFGISGPLYNWEAKNQHRYLIRG